MAPRVGVRAKSLSAVMGRNPHMLVLPRAMADEDWAKIVRYYVEQAPDRLPDQSLPAEPRVDPEFFKVGPFVPGLQSSGIITLLKADPVHKRIFVGEAGSNTLRIFDWNRHLLSSLTLSSPPTGVIAEDERVLVLESGILDPNDEPKGSLVQYDLVRGSLQFAKVLIDSLLRPVFVDKLADGSGQDEFVICEFGNNRGRLALYRYIGTGYERHVLDQSPGAIRFELRDMTGDGHPDLVALFAQGDERIMMFPNDGAGNFLTPPRVLARFPPVYGSMDFSLRDFNGDGYLDILYVNGDNFDYSRVLKPYHGIRILENDGKNNFVERYFFPMYGAAQAVVADFGHNGHLDILVTSNFPDTDKHPERGIMYLENTGGYRFRPYSFTISSPNEWTLMTAADLNDDGWLDVIIGAMDLKSVANMQRRYSGDASQTRRDPILVFENRMRGKRRATIP
jgi:hypothetical protein